MAIQARKLPDAMVFALVAANNKRQLDAVSTFSHADVTSLTSMSDYQRPVATPALVTSTNASTTPTLVALVNEIRLKLILHFSDALAHELADEQSADVEALDPCTNEATAITLLNSLHTIYGDHLDASGVHYTDDETNTDGSSTATNGATAYTRANNIKTKYNAHVIHAPAGAMVELIAP